MSDRKTSWHKLNYHERGERIAELEEELRLARLDPHEANEEAFRIGCEVMKSLERSNNSGVDV